MARGSKPGERRGGRQKGTPNKLTAQLKDCILRAAELAGNDVSDDGQGGTVEYLKMQAVANPGQFMSLLGKVLPLQVTGADEGPLKFTFTLDHAGKDD